MVDTRNNTGTPVMEGPDNKPLLILSRDGEGRVALLLSDQLWLWARGFEGGGPHLDLLRRLSHWLMKEPDLEEESLRLVVSGHNLLVRRQTMAEDIADVTLTSPSGTTRTLKLAPGEPGVWQTSVEANELGLWRATDGKLNALINIGPANPREFTEVTSTTEVLGADRHRDWRRRAPARGGERHQRAAPSRRALRRHLQGRRLARHEDARRQRRARHRRAAGVRRPAWACCSCSAASPAPGRARGGERYLVGRAKARSAVPTLLFCEYLTMLRYRLAKIEGNPVRYARAARASKVLSAFYFSARASLRSAHPTTTNYKLDRFKAPQRQ